jgi:hypothetical protein
MLAVKRIVLDVLKPHQPNALEFCQAIAKAGVGYRVRLTVLEVDEKTESLEIEVSGKDLDIKLIELTIIDNGGSLHSIDEVEVQNEAEPD